MTENNIKPNAWTSDHSLCVFLDHSGIKDNIELLANGPGHATTSYAICEQQRCRSACASAQSDQHLCCSLLRVFVSRDDPLMS